MNELKPCPFCGWHEVGIYPHDAIPGCGAAACRKCHAQGPARPLAKDALAAWNRRADPGGQSCVVCAVELDGSCEAYCQDCVPAEE